MLIVFIYQNFVNDYGSFMEIIFIKAHHINTKQD